MLQDSSRLIAIAQQAHSLPEIVNSLSSPTSQFSDPIFDAGPAAIGGSETGKKLAAKVSGWLPVQVLAAKNQKKSGASAAATGLLYSVSKLAATDVVQATSPPPPCAAWRA
jgi:hypothetical protein